MTLRLPGSIRSRRWGSAWWATGSSRGSAWPRGGCVGRRSSTSGSVHARQPTAGHHRLPAGKGYGVASARRCSGTRPPQVALSKRIVSRACTSRTLLTGWSCGWPLALAVCAAGAWGRTLRRAVPSWAQGGPPPAVGPPGPRQPLRRLSAVPGRRGSGGASPRVWRAARSAGKRTWSHGLALRCLLPKRRPCPTWKGRGCQAREQEKPALCRGRQGPGLLHGPLARRPRWALEAPCGHRRVQRGCEGRQAAWQRVKRQAGEIPTLRGAVLHVRQPSSGHRGDRVI